MYLLFYFILTDHNSKCIFKNCGVGVPCTLTYPWLQQQIHECFSLPSDPTIHAEECDWHIDRIIVWKGHDWNLILNISEFHVGLMFINNCTAGNANESLNKVVVYITLS
jgi:hypothetical protein